MAKLRLKLPNLPNLPTFLRGGRFQTLSIFGAGSLGFLYEIKYLATLFQLIGGTSPVTAAGQTVRHVKDRTGNALNATSAGGMIYEESGRYRYLSGNGTSDTFSVTVPDLGTGVTVVYANELGVITLSGQTIGAGDYALPVSANLFAYLVITPAPSAGNLAAVQAAFAADRPDYLQQEDGFLFLLEGDAASTNPQFLMVS